MQLSTGITSDIGQINEEFKYVVPLPNFGLMIHFQIADWVTFQSKVGVFSIDIDEFNGSLFDMNLSLEFFPLDWLGGSLSYQQFDINVFMPYKGFEAGVKYSFKGPSVGLVCVF
ncbi:hypothetical protein OO013_08210 [Mangrovivirga sp. M17]|uniref:Outer membrane protein beta-barrel domain-containing protein n=1 Tax=Mangrovivirga halotolerans TaxID=2993936 RepID=A0ABT3RRN7_9BACT|nr:hypothetical protein [Mangrovivirga halotolerans]MCX2743845.1 hypothetical protein [Mangrovivirga halotolerans]